MDRKNELKIEVYELIKKLDHIKIEHAAISQEIQKKEQEIHSLNVKGLGEGKSD